MWPAFIIHVIRLCPVRFDCHKTKPVARVMNNTDVLVIVRRAPVFLLVDIRVYGVQPSITNTISIDIIICSFQINTSHAACYGHVVHRAVIGGDEDTDLSVHTG